MKTLKRLTMLLLALGLTVGFAACGDKGGDKSETTSDSTAGEVLGEQVTNTAMDAAIQTAYNATNLVMKGTAVETESGKIFEVSYTIAFADGKVHAEITKVSEGKTEKKYAYISKGDNGYSIWDSYDGQDWEFSERSADSADPTSPQTYLHEYFQYISFFGYPEFDEKTGMYTFTTLGGQSITVKVVGGKIVKFIYEEGQDSRHEAEMTYGNATVGELPSVTE